MRNVNSWLEGSPMMIAPRPNHSALGFAHIYILQEYTTSSTLSCTLQVQALYLILKYCISHLVTQQPGPQQQWHPSLSAQSTNLPPPPRHLAHVAVSDVLVMYYNFNATGVVVAVQRICSANEINIFPTPGSTLSSTSAAISLLAITLFSGPGNI